MVDLGEIDTIFLDVDGALIDLHYDNVLWNKLLPQRFAAFNNLTPEAAARQLLHLTPSGLLLYSIPNWTKITGVDVVELHEELKHLLRFRPGVEEFLDHMQDSDIRVAIVTNAHTSSFHVKNAALSLADRVDTWYSSEQIGLPKEDPEFWEKFVKFEPFEPARTLFIDDTAEVLDSARAAGIAHLLTITQPDLNQPRRTNLTYPAIHDYRELLNGV